MNEKDIQALIDDSAIVETELVIKNNDGTDYATLTQDNSVKSWDYDEKRYVPKYGVIGQFVARTLEGEFQNISDDFVIENKKIQAKFGVAITKDEGIELTTENGSIITTEDNDSIIDERYTIGYDTTYYSLGTFIVDKPEDNEVVDSTSYTATDYTILFNKTFNGDYTDSEYTKSFNQLLSEGTKVIAQWLAKYTCKQCGVELATTNFINWDFEIPDNQFQNNNACRDVMKAIGKLAYSWVRIGWDDKVYIDFTVKKSVEHDYNKLTNDNYYSLSTQNQKYGPINRVLIGTSTFTGDVEMVEDTESIEKNGLHELYIYDNPITYTKELRQKALKKANVLFGLEYDVVEVSTPGYPWLKGDDLIEVSNMEDGKLYTYPFDRHIYYGGYMESDFSSITETEVEQEYNYNGTGKISTNIKNAEATINRAEANIKLLTQEVNQTQEDLKTTKEDLETKIELSSDGILQSVSKKIEETETKLNQNISDSIAESENKTNQNIDSAIKDLDNQISDTLTDYVTTEKLESTISLTTEGIMQNVSKEISSTKTEINQTIETSISESESKTNQSISNAISASENKLNQNISNSITESENKLNGNINSAIENSENKLNQNINNAVDGLEQNINTTLTKYVTTEKFDSTIELTSESILQSVSEDIETTTTNITNNIDTSISDLNNQINDTLNNYATTTTVTNIKNSIENEITSTQQSINVINQVLEDGVTKVDTKTGFTFDQTGLTIAKTNADTKTNINENGMIIYASTGSTDDPMLTVNSNGVIGENMTVRTYFVCGSHSRFEDYETGTGCFYIG